MYNSFCTKSYRCEALNVFYSKFIDTTHVNPQTAASETTSCWFHQFKEIFFSSLEFFFFPKVYDCISQDALKGDLIVEEKTIFISSFSYCVHNNMSTIQTDANMTR